MTLDLAVTQFRPTKGGAAASLQSIARSLRRAKAAEPRPRLVVFPEAALTGYDLEGGVAEQAWSVEELFEALREIHDRTWGDGGPLDVVVGFYERRDAGVFNSALYARLDGADAGIVHVHRKVFLPTYGLFQEKRFLESGSEIRAFDTRWGRMAMLVCEDLWHGTASAAAVRDGARLLLVPSAGPARGPGGVDGEPTSVARWRRIMRATASELGVPIAVSQLVGFEGGKAFAGGAAVVGPDGRELARSPLWEEDVRTARVELHADSDFGPEASGPAGSSPHTDQAIFGGPDDGRGDFAGPVDEDDSSSPAPDPDDRSVLEIDEALVERWLVEFLRLEAMEGRGFDRAVLGLSGGVDSATTAYLAARAFGPDAVTAVLMPAAATSETSRRHATRVVEELGIGSETVELDDAVDVLSGAIGGDVSPLRRGNLAARLRMTVLFDRSKALDAIPLGTGNKSERLLGYFTWHADDAPPVNPLGDLYKSQVWALARHLGVPEEIVERPPSAELEPDQTDEGELGVTYGEADLILYHLLQGRSPADLLEAGFRREAVEIIYGRLHSTHWKRHLPTSAVLTDRAIGVSYLRPVDYRG